MRGTTIQEVFYTVTLNGEKIGRAEFTRSATDRVITSRTMLSLAVNRDGSISEDNIVNIIRETPQGRALSFYYKKNEGRGGSTFIEHSGTISGNLLKIKSRTSASFEEKIMQWPKERFLGTGIGFERQMASKGFRQGTAYTTEVFMPNQLSLGLADIKIGKKQLMAFVGKTRELTEVTVISRLPSNQKIKSIEFRDNDLIPYKTKVFMGGVEMEIIACSKEEALAANSSHNIFKTFDLQSPKDLSGLVRGEALQYHVISKKEGSGMSFPDILGQIALSAGDGLGWHITVKRQDVPQGMPHVAGNETGDIEAALKSTPYLQKEDSKIAAMTKKALNSEKDPGIAVGMIKTFVHDHIINKNYSTGYATAAEVAESGQGDCTEHALLTAAMCRNAGIPARVVYGFVYASMPNSANGIFRMHAWNAVYIGGEWYGLDATKVNGGYGPGHIALFMGNGDPSNMLMVINYFGNLEIQAADVVK